MYWQMHFPITFHLPILLRTLLSYAAPTRSFHQRLRIHQAKRRAAHRKFLETRIWRQVVKSSTYTAYWVLCALQPVVLYGSVRRHNCMKDGVLVPAPEQRLANRVASSQLPSLRLIALRVSRSVLGGSSVALCSECSVPTADCREWDPYRAHVLIGRVGQCVVSQAYAAHL
jgi:hypothetical protein